MSLAPITSPSINETDPTRTNTAIRQTIERLTELDADTDAQFAAILAQITTLTDDLAAAQEENRFPNPAFSVCQDRATGTTIDMTGVGYVMDGVRIIMSASGTLRCAQVLSTTPGGSPYRLRGVVQVADATVNAGDYCQITFPIEGIYVADLLFGAASAKSFTIVGVVRLPAGTYAISFINFAATRSYVHPFTISAAQANTDVSLTITVPGDTTGVWVNGAGSAGISCRLTLVCGSTFQAPTADAWVAGTYLGFAGQSNFMGTLGATVEVADIGFYGGSKAPKWRYPEIGKVLQKCLRYFWKPDLSYGDFMPPTRSNGTDTARAWAVKFLEKMCRAPGWAVVLSGGFSPTSINSTVDGIGVQASVSSPSDVVTITQFEAEARL